MKKAGGFFGGLFGTSTDALEDAGDKFNRAGNAFKASKRCASRSAAQESGKPSVVVTVDYTLQGARLRAHTKRLRLALTRQKRTASRLLHILNARGHTLRYARPPPGISPAH